MGLKSYTLKFHPPFINKRDPFSWQITENKNNHASKIRSGKHHYFVVLNRTVPYEQEMKKKVIAMKYLKMKEWTKIQPEHLVKHYHIILYYMRIIIRILLLQSNCNSKYVLCYTNQQ